MLLHILFAVIGVCILALTLVDVASTVFVFQGSGPLTGRTNHFIFRLMMKLCGYNGRRAILLYASVVLILTTLMLWILLLWVGTSLILFSSNASVINADSKVPADWWEKMYYSAFVISSLGVGDFVAGNDFWRLYTAAIGFIGIMLITTSITYIVPVIDNGIAKRQLSSYIYNLGETPFAIMRNLLSDGSFSRFDTHLSIIVPLLLRYSQTHLAYPILHYAHDNDTTQNAVLNLARLNEVFTILYLYIPKHCQCDQSQLLQLEKAIDKYLGFCRLFY